MVVTAESTRKDFEKGVNTFGDQIRLRFYTGSVSSAEWDDAQVLTSSGADVWISGIVAPIYSTQGSDEALLIEQGKITTQDKRLYITGDTNLSGNSLKIGVGSPVREEHSLIPQGIHSPPLGTGEPLYHKLFIRALPLGSFSGEMG